MNCTTHLKTPAKKERILQHHGITFGIGIGIAIAVAIAIDPDAFGTMLISLGGYRLS